ncbi:hypothetical protein NMY22_g3360 [Coprinellus aureogranulatus]|nr:hypothetical protein NMY22_g3360 [Coprinellus aureogranulatus]
MPAQHAITEKEKVEKKPHVCPPSDATHPRDRWESLYVYSFICKFTNLKHKVQGLESPTECVLIYHPMSTVLIVLFAMFDTHSFEEAVMSTGPNDILTHVLAHFILNLKPQTRNLSTDLISSTVQSVLGEFLKTPERTVFWDDTLNANVDPFIASGGGFFTTSWDFKLKVLRQLVDLQLTHAPSIKAVIDRAWGVVHNKHKKREITPPPDASDPQSRENLQLLPIGQDASRKRYWVADDSPRVYISTNPWKITCSFQSVSSTKDEYMALIETLKDEAPPEPKKKQKRPKHEQAHIDLIAVLESRIEAIDTELARVARARKKIQQRQALYIQAELRETRTRRRTQKPDYVYDDGADSEQDEGDDYRYQEEMDDDEFSSGSRKRKSAPAPTRRSGRAAAARKPSNREESPADAWKNWRGERRSMRLGAPPETQLDDERASKRSRTEESVASGTSAEEPSPKANGTANGVNVKKSGAAALKPTEVAVEQIAGKKKSKFWVYAVEPVPGAAMDVDGAANDAGAQNGSLSIHNGKLDVDAMSEARSEDNQPPSSPRPRAINGAESEDQSMRDSMSPAPMDTA